MMTFKSTHRLSLGAALLSVIGVLAACGGSNSSSSSTTSANLPTKASVNIPKADRFEPFLVEIGVGGTITWTNQDSDTHTIVSMPTDPVDFKLVAPPGKPVSHTFSQAGIYGYFCDAHSTYDPATGLIKAAKGADAYPVSMYGIILVAGNTLPVASGQAKIVMPSADRFDPLTIAVHRGTQVNWTNLDTDAHTVLATPDDSVQFKFVAPANGTVSYTFDQPGMYPYFCDAHALWNADLKRVQAREGSSEFPAAMEGVVFVLP